MKRLAVLLTMFTLLLTTPALARPAHARLAHTRSSPPAPGGVVARPVVFPADTFAHAGVGVEWWYFVGHLADDAGHTYGFETTFFRFGGLRRYGSPIDTFYRTDVAITDEARRRFHHTVVYTPSLPPVTVASTSTLRLRAGALDVSTLGPLRYHIHGTLPAGAVDLTVAAQRPPMLVNNGFIGWGAGYSYYYSLTHMLTTGTLTIGARRIAVHGVTWNDHQWGDMGGSSVKGWQWMALQLSDGTDLSLANERPSAAPYATWAQALLPDNTQRYVRTAIITPLASWRSPATGTTYPAVWHVRVPRLGLDVVVRPTIPDQEVTDTGFLGFKISYWEGSCTVLGTRNGHPVSGKAYVELTGYDTASAAP